MPAPSENQEVFSRLRPGQKLGSSAWITVTQAMVSGFAEATLDPDPMHVDPSWAKANTPYGGTIAFGFQTLALLTHLLRDVMIRKEGHAEHEAGYYLNYGIDYMRLLSPVRVGAKVRGEFTILENRIDSNERNIVKFGCTVHVENEEKPALVADWLSIFVPDKPAPSH